MEWYNGIIRLHTENKPNGARKTLKVIKTENIGGTANLILFAVDTTFDASDNNYDPIRIGQDKVNYYPGYKTYLYHDNTYDLTESHILPNTDDGVRYSIFGFRSLDMNLGFTSKISEPVLMFAQEIAKPEQPRLPIGGLYATRPDFFGKASYTFSTIFEHKPHSVQYNRASDIQILSSIYRTDEPAGPAIYNVRKIKADFFGNKGEKEWFVERWQNLIGFNYDYAGMPSNNGNFEILPNTSEGVALPLPNSQNFIGSINAFIIKHNEYFNQKEFPEALPRVSRGI